LKCLDTLERRAQIPNDLMLKLFKLYESKGQSFYYKDLFSRDDEVMSRNTLEQDTQALAHYLDLKLTQPRIKLLSDPKKDFVAKNKDEILLKNLKEILSKIQTLGETFHLSTNEVKDLALNMSRDYDDIRLIKRNHAKSPRITDNFDDYPTEEKLIRLVEAFNKTVRSKKYETIQIISNFYIDFIKLDLFTEHNELLGLILIYTIISSHFKVCRYDSFFKALLPLKEQFANAFVQACYNWSEGYSQTEPISRIFVSVLDELHKNVEIKAHEYEFDRKMNKSDSIEGTILKGSTTFSKNELRDKHPYSSDATINRTLMSMKERGLIRPLGNGRSAKWQRVAPKNEKFNPQQLELFPTSDEE